MRRIQLDKAASIDRTAATEEDSTTLAYVGLEHIEKETGRFVPGYEPLPQEALATKYRFTAEHVLYGKLRPYLNKVALPSFSGVCTTELLPILPDSDKLNRTYLWGYLLTSQFVEWASRSVSGANLPRLDPKLLASHEIPFPPLDEQQRIAGILAKADRLRRLRRFALALSEDYLQAVFLEMFGDLLSDSPIIIFKKLGQLAVISSGVTKGQKFNGRSTVEVPYLRVANVQDGYLDLSEIKTIEALQSDVDKLTLQSGDILMTEGGDFDKLGRGAIWRGEVDNCIHQNHIFRVRFPESTVLPELFEIFLRTQFAKGYFLQASKKTTNLATINMTQLKALPVPLIPLADQASFRRVYKQYERLRAQQREALRQAEHLFQTLLQRAFGGALS